MYLLDALMEKYISSPPMLPRGRTLPDFTHAGLLVEGIIFQAFCKCGYAGPDRKYPYEANDDLLAHFKKVGTIMEEENEGNRTKSKFWALCKS